MAISSTTIQGDPSAPAAPVSYSDTAPATQNVTAQDVSSATGSGANSQPFILGTPTANSAAVFALSAIDTIRVQVSGLFTGTLVTELSNDGGTLWVSANTVQQTGISVSAGSFTANFHGTVNVAGATHFRVRATTAWTGTAVVRVVESSNSNSVFLSGGSLSISNATLAVTQSGTWNINNISGTISLPTGASTEATLSSLNGKVTAVNTGAVTISTALPAGTNVLGHIIVDSGTITANIGTSGSLALDASVTGLQVAQASTTSGQKGALDFGAVTTASPAYGNGQSSPLSLNTSGSLRTDNTSWLGSTAPTVGSKTSANSVPVVVASDQASIPVKTQDGAGNNLISTSIAGNRRLLVSATDYATEMGLNNAEFTTISNFNLPTNGTETNLFNFANPNASGKTLILRRIIVGPSGGTNGTARIRIYANPTTTANGTAATVSPTNVGGGGTAVATPFTGPTTTAVGTMISATSVGSGTSGALTTTLDMAGYSVTANNKLLITGTPSANNIPIDLTLVWAEA